MYGAVIGDLAGSRHEFAGTKHMNIAFPDERSFITDDSVLTAATAEAIIMAGAESAYGSDFAEPGGGPDYGSAYLRWARRYPASGFGGHFAEWFRSSSGAAVPPPYGSYGNGSAMRVSPVGWLFDREEEVLFEAERSASVTHDHPEGIKGAQAVALAVFRARMARTDRKGGSRLPTDGSAGPLMPQDELVDEILERFGYELPPGVKELRAVYSFDETCQGTLPAALLCIKEAESFEHGIRLSISLGGDADTLGCIVGSILEPLFGGVPDELRRFARSKMPGDMRRLFDAFDQIGPVMYR